MPASFIEAGFFVPMLGANNQRLRDKPVGHARSLLLSLYAHMNLSSAFVSLTRFANAVDAARLQQGPALKFSLAPQRLRVN